jgi:CRP/FNR family cyclic AMP-dependent transcriptional regulator
MDLENAKRIFLVASDDPALNRKIETLLKAQFLSSTVFKAIDGPEALFKCENVPPQVVILDSALPKMNVLDLTEKLLQRKDRIAVIVLSPSEPQDKFMNEVVTGQVQFLSSAEIEGVFNSHLNRALNWVNQEANAMYRLRFLGTGERLITAGETAMHVYLVRSGELKATKAAGDHEIVLGIINPGEFVGEMAYINGEARSANVTALSDCELIEFHSDTLDAVLFSKPAWAKALMKTLSKRLKISNEIKA